MNLGIYGKKINVHLQKLFQTILIYKPERLQKSSQPLERLRPLNDVIQLPTAYSLL